MGKIVAIGGGEIVTKETLAIDREIIKLSGKKHPTVVFLPTASSDSSKYIDDFNTYYGKQLGCRVHVLFLIKDNALGIAEIENKILNADIVYVGGGNTLMMMMCWRRLGVDKILAKAYQKGIVLSGVSAGSICWFDFGVSDSRRFKDSAAPLIKVRGLGFVNASNCPHYHSRKYAKDRAKTLKKAMSTSAGVAIAIDDFCALEIVGDMYKIIRSRPSSKAYKVCWKHGKYINKEIDATKLFSPLSELLKK
jgi:dipeptidase E